MATCTDSNPNTTESFHPDLVQKKAAEKYQHREGHELIFVKQPPKEVQLECSICLQFLSDPCHTDCECGNSFCRDCIETINDMNNPCPLCNEEFDIIIPSKQLKRNLNSLHVYCPHKDSGCDWTDELGRLFDHFNSSPTADSRLQGCGFICIACKYCNNLIPRGKIPNHEANLCPNKPYNCQYCDYSSVFNDITDNHWPVCLKFPVPCPFKCGETLERLNIEVHVDNECGNVPVECDFSYIGCKDTPLRKDMPAHSRENMVEHMSLLAISHSKETQQLTEEIIELRTEMRELKKENVSLTNCLADTQEANRRIVKDLSDVQQESAHLKIKIASLQVELEKHTLQTENPHLVKKLHSDLRLPPVKLTMNNFKQRKRNDTVWYSPPFYTHDQGYKMCIQVYPHGRKQGYGTHLSVYACLMKGDFDSMLKWPFQGVITIKLIDQRLGRHCVENIVFDDSLPQECTGRLFSDEFGRGLGSPNLMEQKFLNPNFLKDDCLKFEITEVKLT